MKNSFELYNKAVSIKARTSIRNLGKRRIHNLVGSWEFNKEENSSLTLQHEVNQWIWEYQLDCQWCSILNLYTFWTLIIVIFEVVALVISPSGCIERWLNLRNNFVPSAKKNARNHFPSTFRTWKRLYNFWQKNHKRFESMV